MDNQLRSLLLYIFPGSKLLWEGCSTLQKRVHVTWFHCYIIPESHTRDKRIPSRLQALQFTDVALWSFSRERRTHPENIVAHITVVLLCNREYPRLDLPEGDWTFLFRWQTSNKHIKKAYYLLHDFLHLMIVGIARLWLHSWLLEFLFYFCN